MRSSLDGFALFKIIQDVQNLAVADFVINIDKNLSWLSLLSKFFFFSFLLFVLVLKMFKQ